MALGNSKVNKVECTQWATNESYRPNELLLECPNRILIGLQMAKKIAKYARSRSSFIRNRNAITKGNPCVLPGCTNHLIIELEKLSLLSIRYGI